MNAMNAWIGIDISKATFDACLLRQQSKPVAKAFSNDRQGFTQLLAWVQSHAAGVDLHFCLEATGAYGEALACFLAQAEQKVSVINPARIRFAGLSQGAGNKTDRADARLIADYCRKENPPLWRAAAPEVRELVALLRRLHSRHTMVQQEKNRSAEPHLTTGVRNSVEETLQFLNQQIAALQSQIRSWWIGTPTYAVTATFWCLSPALARRRPCGFWPNCVTLPSSPAPPPQQPMRVWLLASTAPGPVCTSAPTCLKPATGTCGGPCICRR